MRKLLIFVAPLLLSITALAQTPFSVNITVDENGHGTFTNTTGFNQALTGTLMNDPGPGGLGLVPAHIGAVFVTPSVRANLFYGQGVSPWVSIGGGYGHFSESSTLSFGAPNTGSTGTSTGVLQVGAGLDVWPWTHWGGRLEARDFYSGIPDYDVVTSRTRQHNFYVGVGVIYRF